MAVGNLIALLIVIVFFAAIIALIVKFVSDSARGNTEDINRNHLDISMTTDHVNTVTDTMLKASQNLMEMKKLQSQIVEFNLPNPKMQDSIQKTCDSFEKLLRYICQNPERAPENQVFLDQYVPIVLKSSKSHIGALKMNSMGAERTTQLEKLQVFLLDTEKAFDRHLQKQVQQEFTQTNIEMDSMSSVYRSEGLIDDFEQNQNQN